MRELISPSDYEPPGRRLPRQVLDAGPIPRPFPVAPHLFDTEELGAVFRLRALQEDGQGFVVKYENELNELMRLNSFQEDLAEVQRPEFTRQHLVATVRLQEGEYQFLGTVTPEDRKHEVWWAFLTLRAEDCPG